MTKIWSNNNSSSIYVHSISGKRMEIIIIVSDDPRHHQPVIDRIDFEEITGNGSLQGLIAVKNAIPGVLKWIESIGYTPVADPADPRRARVFAPYMEKLGINQY